MVFYFASPYVQYTLQHDRWSSIFLYHMPNTPCNIKSGLLLFFFYTPILCFTIYPIHLAASKMCFGLLYIQYTLQHQKKWYLLYHIPKTPQAMKNGSFASIYYVPNTPCSIKSGLLLCFTSYPIHLAA